MASKKTAAAKEQIYLVISEERGNGYYHLRARVRAQRYETGEGMVPYGCDDMYGDGPLYSDLRVSCQGDQDSRFDRRPHSQHPVYGFSTEYRDVWSVDLRKVKRMAKTLTALQAKLDKFYEARGAVTTFGEYLGRVAEALGCSGMVFQHDGSYTGAKWTWLSVGDGVNRANHMIAAWVEEGRPKPAVSGDSEAVAS